MRILVISQFFPPDITAAAFRIGDMVGLLRERGHEVAVLTALPHKAMAADDELDDGAEEGSRVMRTKLIPIGPGGGVRYIVHYLSFVMGSALQGLRLWFGGHRVDVIWVSSPPLFVGISAVFLSLVFRCPVVMEVRDIWPDSAVAAGQLPGSGLFYRIGKWLELALYRRASRILCVARPMAKRVMEQTSTHVTVAYNGVLGKSAERLVGSDDERPEAEFKTILYAGNIGHVQELDLLVGAFAKLSGEGLLREWKLRILGTGARVESLRALVAELGIEHVISIDPPVAREEAWKAQASADVLYINLKNDPVLGTTIPSKVFDYLLTGRPILAGIVGEGREILERTGGNITFEPGNVAELEAALLRLVEGYEALSRAASKNRELVVQEFTREKATDVLLEALEAAVGGRVRVTPPSPS